MKNFYSLIIGCLILFLFALNIHAQQGVAINTTGVQAHSSAMLDVSSTDKGLLIPRVTTIQRNAIVNPATGLLVYDTDFKQFWYFEGSIWIPIMGVTGVTGPTGPLISGSSGQTIRHNGTAWIANSLLYNNGTNVGINTTSPSDKLHINGNLRFDGSLKANGNAGSQGQLLVSQGTQGPPQWQNPTTVNMYGNNASSVQLNALATNTTEGAWTDIPGMTITFTPQHSVVYLFASLCARLANTSGMAQMGQAMVRARILVNGVEVAKAASIITDYDKNSSSETVITSGTVAFSGVMANVTIGQSTIIKLQWMPIKAWATTPWRLEINPTLGSVADHCVLTVFD